MSVVDQFLADQNGKSLDFDGKFGSQCVDSVAFFVRDYLHLPVFYADASRWFTDFDGSPLAGSFDKIANNKSDSTQLPQTNDLIIWSSDLPNSGGAGHIAICQSASSDGFLSIDQNWSGQYVHLVKHNWSYVIGWLRPHVGGSGSGQKEDQVSKPTIATLRILQTEAAGSDLNFVHSGQFDNQLHAAYDTMDVNDVVYRFWENGIKWRDYRTKVINFYNSNKDLPAQYEQLKQQADELAKRPTQANFDALRQLLTDTQGKEQKLEAVQEADKTAGDTFLRRVGQLIKKYLPL
jgi:hypothetical protein